jgi:protein-L-isoaspartate(D-aspartate) O-methyltransferase
MIPDWAGERAHMVEQQLRRRGICDERVLCAMGQIQREEFVPTEARVMAYRDDPIPIGFGQTISQPYMTALMAEALELTGTETVLEVGTGSGYAAAVLAELAAHVVSVEIVPGLIPMARANLRRTLREARITLIEGDGSMGFAEFAPFDAISVAAGAPEVPVSLLEQLNDPGRLVIPVGDRADQELRVVWKQNGRIEYRVATQCRFVLLRGGEGWR